jgi:type IV secretion system protein VirB9
MTTRPRSTSSLALLLALALAGAPLAAVEPEHVGAWTILPYGASNPTLTCLPLAACLVALEDGETVQARFLPDTARWETEIGSTGPGGRTPVLAIKPKDCGITSNLYVTTDRRVYTFVLSSPACDPTALSPATLRFDQVRFNYPEEFSRIWHEPVSPPALGIPTAATQLSELNFDYDWDAGRHGVDPKAVYDDGSRTFIVIKASDRNADSPAVFIRGEGNKLEAVNFTPPTRGGTTYTVDRVVPEILLVSGASSSQRTVIHNRRAR